MLHQSHFRSSRTNGLCGASPRLIFWEGELIGLWLLLPPNLFLPPLLLLLITDSASGVHEVAVATSCKSSAINTPATSGELGDRSAACQHSQVPECGLCGLPSGLPNCLVCWRLICTNLYRPPSAPHTTLWINLFYYRQPLCMLGSNSPNKNMKTKDRHNRKKLTIHPLIIFAHFHSSPAQQLDRLYLIFKILHIFVASLQVKAFSFSRKILRSITFPLLVEEAAN